MAVKSAYEDLRERTLGRIEGIWAKLGYVADRRSGDGAYRHWGFERTHGTAGAQEAFTRMHQTLVETILQTRLSSLREDLEQTSGALRTSPASYVSKLTAGLPGLLPSDCSKMTELHLISILKTLSALEKRQQLGSQSASRRPPLGRSLPPPAGA